MGAAGVPRGLQRPPHRGIEAVADFLPGSRGGRYGKPGGCAGLLRHLQKDHFRRGASADVAVADKKDLFHLHHLLKGPNPIVLIRAPDYLETHRIGMRLM